MTPYTLWGTIMQLLRFRVRTLMMAVGVAALAIWGAMMGARSYDYYKLARHYATQERAWREIAARKRSLAKFDLECAEYYAPLAQKYCQAMWHPWMPVARDPLAPGVSEFLNQ